MDKQKNAMFMIFTVKFESLRVYPIFCRLFAIQLYSIIPNGGIEVSVYIASDRKGVV